MQTMFVNKIIITMENGASRRRAAAGNVKKGEAETV
jgi:hypothetical protein